MPPSTGDRPKPTDGHRAKRSVKDCIPNHLSHSINFYNPVNTFENKVRQSHIMTRIECYFCCAQLLVEQIYSLRLEQRDLVGKIMAANNRHSLMNNVH